MTTLSVEHITKTPGVCGGKACIAGHRIRVLDIVAHHEHAGRTPAEILEHFPGVTLADVYAALAYYHDHRAEIEADFANEREWAEFGKTQPSKLKAKLEADPGLRERILGNRADG